jgi:hypothetical protein
VPTNLTEEIPANLLRGRAILLICLVLMVLPPCVFSSPEYIQPPRILALLAITLIGRKWLPVLYSAGSGWKILFIGLAIAHVSSLIGGLQHGGAFSKLLRLAVQGTFGVTGLSILIYVALTPHWQKAIARTGLGLLVMLLGGSLIAYFIPIERYFMMGAESYYFEPPRLSLFWLTKVPMAWLHQVAWEHANFAGMFFAIGMVLTIDRLASESLRKNLKWWLLAIAFGTAVFLTGSRTAWLIIGLSLPFVLIRRPLRFSLQTTTALAVSLLLGLVCLKANIACVRATPAPAGAPSVGPPNTIGDLHLSGLVDRGSSGRLSGYQILWDSLAGSRTFGQGLPVTHSRVAHLMHEHSSYLATLRGGGFVALAAHAAILLGSLWIAATLFFKGNLRWPLVFLIATLTAILFDHSNVFHLTGRYDFLFHWTAVLIPLILFDRNKQDRSTA